MGMQIAAASPSYATRDEVPADLLEKEKAIYRAQMENAGKPPAVLEKIIEGKLGSYYSQVVLPDQPSIRDPKATVKDVIAAAERVCGHRIPVKEAARRAGDPPALIGSAVRARDVLGWSPTRSDLDVQIADAWTWLRSRALGPGAGNSEN